MELGLFFTANNGIQESETLIRRRRLLTYKSLHKHFIASIVTIRNGSDKFIISS